MLKILGAIKKLGALKTLEPLGSARGGRNFWWSALGTRIWGAWIREGRHHYYA
jgi:hypothetical protein